MTDDTPTEPTEGDSAFESRDLSWFDGGAPVPDDFVDDELVNMDSADAWGQPMVLALLATFALILAFQYTSDLRFFFTSRTAVDLNAGTDDEYTIADSWSASGDLVLPSNRYVAVSGISERKSVARDRLFYKLVGAQIYVERVVIDERPRILRGQPIPVERGQESIRPLHDEPGRLIAFSDLPKRYSRLIQFYSDNYRVHFCGFEPSDLLAQYQYRIRQEASRDLELELGRTPTDEEISARAGPGATCQSGYLLLSGDSPADYWFFPLLYLAFGLIMFGSAFFAARRLRSGSEDRRPGT